MVFGSIVGLDYNISPPRISVKVYLVEFSRRDLEKGSVFFRRRFIRITENIVLYDTRCCRCT